MITSFSLPHDPNQITLLSGPRANPFPASPSGPWNNPSPGVGAFPTPTHRHQLQGFGAPLRPGHCEIRSFQTPKRAYLAYSDPFPLALTAHSRLLKNFRVTALLFQRTTEILGKGLGQAGAPSCASLSPPPQTPSSPPLSRPLAGDGRGGVEVGETGSLWRAVRWRGAQAWARRAGVPPRIGSGTGSAWLGLSGRFGGRWLVVSSGLLSQPPSSHYTLFITSHSLFLPPPHQSPSVGPPSFGFHLCHSLTSE